MMKLNDKFLLALLGITLITCFLGYGTLRTYAFISYELNQIQQDSVPHILRLISIKSNLTDVITALKDAINTYEFKDKKAFIHYQRILKNDVETLLRNPIDGMQKNTRNEMERSVSFIFQSIDQIEYSILRGGMHTANQALYSKLLAQKHILYGLLDEELLRAKTTLLQSESQIIKQQRRGTLWIWITILVSLCVALIVAYSISRHILQPFHSLKHAAIRLGGGDLEYRVHIVTGDEIEELGQAFNQMAEKLSGSFMALEKKSMEQTLALSRAHTQLKNAVLCKQEGHQDEENKHIKKEMT